jgi:hypothetical protein
MVTVLAGTAAVALAAAMLLSAPWSRDRPAPPGPAAPPVPSPSPESADALLRERLGGLAGMVIGGDPQLRACADPGPVADPTAGDPVERVIEQVEAVRGVTLDDPPEIRLLHDAEMTAQVAEAFADQLDEQQVDLDTRTLTALGAIAPGTDLAHLRKEVYARQVSGYHDAAEGLIVLRVGDPSALSPLERVVLAHEVEHALADVHFDPPVEDPDETEDSARARAAVVEGSAVVTMLQYATAALTPAEQAAMRDELLARAGEHELAGYSPYLRAQLQFPYVAGVRYICQRWLAGGWEAVADAYRDPPRSTAAVLFPDRHDEQPRQPAPLADPGGDWEPARTSRFGAAELEWLLAAPGGSPGAALDRTRQRVAAWDGGELAVWTGEAGTVLGLALVDSGEGPPLCDTVRQWYAAAFPMAKVGQVGTDTTFTAGRQDAALACPGDQVRLGIGPTTADARAVTR